MVYQAPNRPLVKNNDRNDQNRNRQIIVGSIPSHGQVHQVMNGMIDRKVPDEHGDTHTDGHAEEIHQQHGIGQKETPGQRYRPACGHHTLSDGAAKGFGGLLLLVSFNNHR
jgi:hypothetical protein